MQPDPSTRSIAQAVFVYGPLGRDDRYPVAEDVVGAFADDPSALADHAVLCVDEHDVTVLIAEGSTIAGELLARRNRCTSDE